MSGGQRQRVAIARAIAGPDKQFLVVDEPTASLDSVAARMIVELFVDLRTQGLGVLMTTHDSRLASYGDRIVVLRDGALVENSGVGWQ